MPTMRFERIALALLVISLIEHAQAQPGYVPPPTPLPPPVLNPSTPYTVPQPSYQPITPTTPSTTPSTPSIVPRDEVTSPTVPNAEATPPANEEALVQPLGLSDGRARSITTEAARHRRLILAAI